MGGTEVKIEKIIQGIYTSMKFCLFRNKQNHNITYKLMLHFQARKRYSNYKSHKKNSNHNFNPYQFTQLTTYFLKTTHSKKHLVQTVLTFKLLCQQFLTMRWTLTQPSCRCSRMWTRRLASTSSLLGHSPAWLSLCLDPCSRCRGSCMLWLSMDLSSGKCWCNGFCMIPRRGEEGCYKVGACLVWRLSFHSIIASEPIKKLRFSIFFPCHTGIPTNTFTSTIISLHTRHVVNSW